MKQYKIGKFEAESGQSSGWEQAIDRQVQNLENVWPEGKYSIARETSQLVEPRKPIKHLTESKQSADWE